MNTAIILAAGKGTRMNTGINKQYIEISGKAVIVHTLEVFQNCNIIDEIIVVASENEFGLCEKIVNTNGFSKVKSITVGGAERQDSVSNGLDRLNGNCGIVCIHDGARMLIKENTILRCVEAAIQYGVASAGVPVKDTIKIVGADDMVRYTPNRKNIWVTQTPQAFKTGIIKFAHRYAVDNTIAATDDAALAELVGYPVKMIAADYENIKITTPEDVIIAEAILAGRNKTNCCE